MLRTVTTAAAMHAMTAAWRASGDTIGFIPTMGALHDGHLALVKQMQKQAKRTVASVFVNPLQFGPDEDFHKYPRPLEADQEKLKAAGCDALFAPAVEEMYPAGFVTSINPGPLAALLEGTIRPGHFAGVATVVTKLLLQVLPDLACFGEKDWQQLQVINRVVRDLAIPVTVVAASIVREPDGLAMSSRNAYLAPDERARATALSQTLFDSAARLRTGEGVQQVLVSGLEKLTQAGFTPDYFVLADGATLESLDRVTSSARLLAAARLGPTRLIDNVAVV